MLETIIERLETLAEVNTAEWLTVLAMHSILQLAIKAQGGYTEMRLADPLVSFVHAWINIAENFLPQ